MTKRQNIFMGWSLGLAGLLIAVLYSPVGSPYIYVSADSFSESLDVIPRKGMIANAPRMQAVYENTQDELNLPELSTFSTNRGTGYTGSTKNQSKGSFNRTAQFPTFQNSNSSSNGMGGSPLLAGGRSHSPAGSSAIIMTNGITTLSMSSDLGNNITRQNATDQTTTTDDLTGPGDPPTGDPIPAGDGWGLLVLFGVGYAIYKKLFRINQ